MTAAGTARMLARYNAWANRLIFDAVGQLPPGEATRERQTLFRNMVHTLNHNYVIDLIWQAHLEGRPHGFTARNTAEHPPLPELWTAQQAVDAWYVAWSDHQTDAALEERVAFTFVGGGAGAMTRGQILRMVEMPLAAPTIIAGLRIAAVTTIGCYHLLASLLPTRLHLRFATAV